MSSRRSADEHRFARVQRQIEAWRRTRVHSNVPMPPRLWAAAVALTERHGLYPTARTLRIDYGALRRHVGTARRPEASAAPPTFVELPAAGRVPRECAIEIDGPHGRLRLRIADLPLREVATLGRLLAGLDA
jgi:hypothetical protein